MQLLNSDRALQFTKICDFIGDKAASPKKAESKCVYFKIKKGEFQ